MKFFRILLFLILAGIGVIYFFFLSPNFSNKNTVSLYIPTGATYNQVLDSIEKYSIVKNMTTFRFVESLLSYDKYVKPGKYNIDTKAGNLSWIRKIRNGIQDPIKVTLSNVDSPQELAQRLGNKLEQDSIDFIQVILSNDASKNINVDNRWGLFLCNTYELYWTSSPEKVLERMSKEFDRYFEGDNGKKATAIGLSPIQVITLASIVQKETYKTDEQGKVARVYLNRIAKGIPLQADPTVKYALGDPSIKRVLNRDLAVESPYNTYKYAGLPPGPICLPELSCVEEVLNAPHHNYIFFCASPQFNGYHLFAESASQHEANAQAYRKALNERKIFR